MRTFFDCIPCFVRQALDSARAVSDAEDLHERLLRQTLRALGEMDLRESPPAMAQRIHRLIRAETGLADPYREIKDRCNRLALGLYDELQRRVSQAPDPLEAAVRLAIAGNIIDFGVRSEIPDAEIHAALESCFEQPLAAEAVAELADATGRAESILYLADNAGEIVFDRLLVERLPAGRVTVAVKSGPVINDATMADAVEAGLTDIAEVIGNGSDAPGTILADCDEAFRRRFEQADVVIAKGQGNYETLSECGRDVFFVLKAKCPVIARHLGCSVGDLVLERSSAAEDRELSLAGI